jgi:hypothetical protein
MATRFSMQTGPSSKGLFVQRSTSYQATNASSNTWFGMAFNEMSQMNSYVAEVVSAERRRQESAARQQANLAGLELQMKQLPETLNLLESQYAQSLDLLTRRQEVENAMFAPQRQQMEAQQQLERRRFGKEVGKVQASFGARGLAYSNTAMADMQREAALLRQVDEAQSTLLNLSEKETGVKQDQARTELKQQIENSRLGIKQKVENLDSELKYQKDISKLTSAKLVASPSNVLMEMGNFGTSWTGGLTGGSYTIGGSVQQVPMDFLYDVAMGLAGDQNFKGTSSEILNASAKYLNKNAGSGQMAGAVSGLATQYGQLMQNAYGGQFK